MGVWRMCGVPGWCFGTGLLAKISVVAVTKLCCATGTRAHHGSCGSENGDRCPIKGDTSGATARVGRIWLNAGGRRGPQDQRRKKTFLSVAIAALSLIFTHLQHVYYPVRRQNYWNEQSFKMSQAWLEICKLCHHHHPHHLLCCLD